MSKNAFLWMDWSSYFLATKPSYQPHKDKKNGLLSKLPSSDFQTKISHCLHCSLKLIGHYYQYRWFLLSPRNLGWIHPKSDEINFRNHLSWSGYHLYPPTSHELFQRLSPNRSEPEIKHWCDFILYSPYFWTSHVFLCDTSYRRNHFTVHRC